MLKLINSNNIKNSIKLSYTTNNNNLIRFFSINSNFLNEGESEVKGGKNELKEFDIKYNSRNFIINSTEVSSYEVNKVNINYKKNFIPTEFDETLTFKSLKTLEPSVIVLVLDLLDIDNSIPKGLSENLPPNVNLIVTANYIDSLKEVGWQKSLKSFVIAKLKLCKLKWKGAVTLIDGNLGTRVEALKDTIKRYNKGNDKVTFLGPRSSNLRQLIELLYVGSAFETKKLTVPIAGIKSITIDSYIPIESTNPESIKFSSNYLNICGQRPSYLDCLDPEQIKSIVPRGKSIGKLTPHNPILPNTTIEFDNLLRLEYYGLDKIFLNNFTLIQPKFTPIFNKKSIKYGEVKLINSNSIRTGMYFTNKILLPLNLPSKFQRPENYNLTQKRNKYSFDISLPGLGWLSFNTKNIVKYPNIGFIMIYTLNGIKLPISRARLPNWSYFDNKTKRFINDDEINEGQGEGEDREKASTTAINEGLEHDNNNDITNNSS